MQAIANESACASCRCAVQSCIVLEESSDQRYAYACACVASVHTVEIGMQLTVNYIDNYMSETVMSAKVL